MSGNQRPLEVLVYGRTGFIGSFVFTEAKVSIGRDVESMVHLDDALVSRKHAVVVRDGGFVRIKDLSSRTGTKVNGAPLLPRQPLEPTDEVTIGPFRLRVTTCEPDAEEGVPSSDDLTRQVPSSAPEPPTLSVKTPRALFETSEETVTNLIAILHGAPVAHKPALPPPEPPPAKLQSTKPQATAKPPVEARTVTSPTPAPVQPQRAEPKYVFIEPPAAAVPPPPPSSTQPPAPVPAHLAAPSATNAANAPSQRPAGAYLHTDTVPLAFAAGQGGAASDYDDDDEDDDSDFVPPFDLVDSLLRETKTDDPSTRGKKRSLEVIHYRGDRVISVAHPHSKGPLKPIGSIDPVGAVESDGACLFNPEAVRAFTVQERGRTLTTAEALAMRDGAVIRVVTGMEVSAELEGDDKILIRWVPPTAELRPPRVLQRPPADQMTSGVLSAVVHFGIMLFVGLVVLADKKGGDTDINAGRFATVNMKELELEPPPPPPPEAPVADVPPTIELAPTSPRERAIMKTKASPAMKGAPQQPSPTPNASTQRILSALGGTTSAVSAISVTNLDALPAGAGDFKVSGSLGKAPGDTLRIAAAGSGSADVNTKSANELGGNNLGRVQAVAGTAVRARVTAAPQSIRGEGHLDRSEIQKVVNAHLFQVQGCYERQLAKDPSLSGKISFEWVVEMSGGVSSVRIGRSSLHSVEATTCIQSAIQGWKFPSPVGGSVTVTYPFAFSSLGT